MFTAAPTAQRTAQQDTFFQSLGVQNVQVVSGVNGTQEVAITMQNGTQPGVPMRFGLTQNEYFQPHKILEKYLQRPHSLRPNKSEQHSDAISKHTQVVCCNMLVRFSESIKENALLFHLIMQEDYVSSTATLFGQSSLCKACRHSNATNNCFGCTKFG